MQLSAAIIHDGCQSFGKVGEGFVCSELVRYGYAILEPRYRTVYEGIEIIRRSGRTIVFVKVKARANDAYGGSGTVMISYKQERIVRRAANFSHIGVYGTSLIASTW